MARTGRPREFDREKALDAALTLFWEQGFEPTSLNQLKASMGNISPASFYAAFGSKESLFREVVERYQSTYGQVTLSLFDLSLAPRDAIEMALRKSAQMQSDETHPLGCLIILGASNCGPDNRHVDEILATDRQRNRHGIEQCIRRGIAQGELSERTDVSALAGVLHTFLMGIALEAKDGTKRDQLDRAVTMLLTIWDMNRLS